MIKKALTVGRIAAFCVPLTLLASCGGSGSSGPQAVQGTRININPVSVGITSAATGATLVALYYVQSYQIELRSPSGDAQINTQVTIISSGLLYDGLVVINPAAVSCTASATAAATCVNNNPAQTPVSNVYQTVTSNSGTVRVTLLFPFYSGSKGTVTVLEALSGTSAGKTDAVFTCTGSTAVPCPT